MRLLAKALPAVAAAPIHFILMLLPGGTFHNLWGDSAVVGASSAHQLIADPFTHLHHPASQHSEHPVVGSSVLGACCGMRPWFKVKVRVIMAEWRPARTLVPSAH